MKGDKITMRREIENITKEAIQRYCMTTSRDYLDDKKKENNLTKQYEGREIYELLQNIDDAASPNRQCIASIVFDGDYLIVSNNGVPFSISTLQRLCQGGVSEKNADYIGCKGIGFRSVLNWADEISIYSGCDEAYIPVKFSREYAQSQLDKLLSYEDPKIKKHLQEQIKELEDKGFDSSYPIFRAPQFIGPEGKDFDTVIKLKVKKELKEKIIKELENIERYRYILLFLPHLNEIKFEIISSNRTIRYFIFSKKVINDKIELTINDNGDSSSSLYIYEAYNEKLSKKYDGSDIIKLAVAIPCNETEIYKCNLYTFFPILDLSCPFPALLNATFFLTDNRNDLDLNSAEKKEVNKIVFERLLRFYIDTVIENIDGERRLKLLIPFNFPKDNSEGFYFNGSLAKLQVEEIYLDMCKNEKIFYTVNNEYLRGSDSLIILDSFPDVAIFKGKSFSTIVKYTDDIQTRSFSKRIIGNNISVENYLYQAINIESDHWNITERIQIFKWWHSQTYTLLPKLLKTIDGQYLEKKNEPCFLSEDTIPEWVKSIPCWATISVLDSEDQKHLILVFKEEISKVRKSSEAEKRVLARIINNQLVDIQEQSSRQVVISPINASVNGNFDYAVEFLKWLWHVWDESSFDDTIKTKINFVVPTKDMNVTEARNVFLGEDYGNEFGKCIFSQLGNYAELYRVEFENVDSDRLDIFFKEIGVSKYPRLKEVSTNQVGGIEKQFIDYVLKSHPIKNLNNDDWIKSYNTVYYTVENIEYILKNLDSKYIIKWIFADSELRNAIENDTQPSNCRIEYLLSRKRHAWRHNNEWHLPSFLRYVFSNIKWLQLEQKRYAPNELILTNNDYLNDFGLICISEYDIEDYSKGICDKEDLRKLLIILGAKRSFLELGSDKFYGLLLALPNGDSYKAKRISRELYRLIIDNSSTLDKYAALNVESENKKKFRKEGKVLVKNRTATDGSFVEINKAFFSSSAVLGEDNKFPIDVPARRGKKEDFEKLLFIKPYEIAYTVLTSKISECNGNFQSDLNSFIPCVMAYRQGKKDEICNLTIELVKSVTIVLNGVTKECSSEYTLLKKANKHWLICVGNEDNYQYLEKGLIADNLVQIFNVLFNFPSKEFLNKVEQLFVYSHKQRLHSIEYDLGSLDEIELANKEINHSNELYTKMVKFFECEDNEEMLYEIKQVNWNYLLPEDQKKVIELLKQTNKSIDELNHILGKIVSIAGYNKELFLKHYESDKQNVCVDIYSTIKEKLEKHKSFNAIRNEFEHCVYNYNDGFDRIDFDNVVSYNELKCNFYSKYDISQCNDLDYSCIKRIYDENSERLKKLFNKTDLSLNDYTNDPFNDSLLYFKNERLTELVSSFIEERDSELKNERAIDNQQITYLDTLVNNTIVGHALTSGTARDGITNTGNGGITRSTTEKTERRNKKQGNIAEYIVIIKLANKEIEQVNSFFQYKDYNIFWVSGAAKEIQIIKEDKQIYNSSETEDSAGYDIKLVSIDKTKTMYIEVKSSSSDNCSFFMSANELDEASKKNSQSEQYRIIFVSNINIKDKNRQPRITFIDAPIDEVFDAKMVQCNMTYNQDRFNRYKKKEHNNP